MEISPEVLEFSAPFTEQSTKPLQLTNNGNTTLAYKIKTTAPKLYCVRPNASVIDPGESVEVSIIRQGKEVPNPESKHKDKFLVLSCAVQEVDRENTNFGELWSEIEKDKKNDIDSKKIRVSYIYHPPPSPPSEEAGGGAIAAGSNNTSMHGDEFDTPAKSAGVEDSFASPAPVAMSETEHSTTSGSSRFIDDEKMEYAKREVDQAKQKISSMSKEVKSKVEQSVPQPVNDKAAKVAQQVRQQPNGVSVPVVLVLTLIAFFIGWKLF